MDTFSQSQPVPVVGKKIIIVEDEPQLQEVYLKKLTDEGFVVETYVTGKEGLEAIKKSPPGLIILDIMLPGGLNGFDVLEILKKDETTKTIPVLMLTNLDSEEETAKKVGASDYIIKTNITIDGVIGKIKSYFP